MKKDCPSCVVGNRNRYGVINQACLTCRKISNWIGKG